MVNDYTPIPLIRCKYLHLFIETLEEFGMAVDSELCESRLPDETPNRSLMYVPAHPALNFIIDITKKYGIEGLGARAGSKLDISIFDEIVRQHLQKARTLGEALNAFCLLVDREQSHVHCHVKSIEGKQARICGTVAMSNEPEQCQYSEWILIMSVLYIIRHAAGKDWSPDKITFHSQPSLCESDWKAFPGTKFCVEQPDTSISMDYGMLSLPWPDCRIDDKFYPTRPRGTTVPDKAWDFPNSLRAALRPYLNDGYPSIKLAAKITGTSVRTLQRRLSQCRLSYSDLVKQLRFDASLELLCDPHKKVLDAALELGFTDPSHFSRAFRHVKGVSPREFRKQQVA
jgi:AraC-like DNA-binding protein